MTISTIRNAIASASLALALGTSLIANTAAADDQYTGLNKVTVSFSDLDLSKPAGAKVLYKRIRAAARKVCTPTVTISPIYVGRHFYACYDEAVASAIAQVNRPMLTALHREKTKTARG
jgi:UrcA family protein